MSKHTFGWIRRLKAGLVNPEFIAATMEILLLWLGAMVAVALLAVFSGGRANAAEQPAPHSGKSAHIVAHPAPLHAAHSKEHAHGISG